MKYSVSSINTPDTVGEKHYYDGYSVYYDGDGTYSYAFAINMDGASERTFKIEVDADFKPWPEIEVVEKDPINYLMDAEEMSALFTNAIPGVGSANVMENGEFIKVGSSKVQKTDVRVVAATNLNIPLAIEKGKFREDLYYRLNTVPIHIPSLRERKEDIRLLFRKFAADCAEKYRMPALQLTQEALIMMENYRWDGNIRQLKNITEQISIIENERIITPDILKNYLPNNNVTALPTLYKGGRDEETISERDLLYKVLFDMKNDIIELRKTVKELSEQRNSGTIQHLPEPTNITPINATVITPMEEEEDTFVYVQDNEEEEKPVVRETETLSLVQTEKELICKALERHKGKRKDAAKELGISERTLYRKINEYKINL